MWVNAEELIKSDYLWAEGGVLRVVDKVLLTEDARVTIVWHAPATDGIYTHVVDLGTEYFIHRRKI